MDKKNHPSLNHNNKHNPGHKPQKPNKHQESTSKKQKFVQSISDNCTRNFNLDSFELDKECGYANKSFVIYREERDPWRVKEGHYLDWSDDKVLKIQQLKQGHNWAGKGASKDTSSSVIDVLMNMLGRAVVEKTTKEMSKLFEKPFEIPWRFITGVSS